MGRGDGLKNGLKGDGPRESSSEKLNKSMLGLTKKNNLEEGMNGEEGDSEEDQRSHSISPRSLDSSDAETEAYSETESTSCEGVLSDGKGSRGG